ncbi:ATP-dependent RNA helicase-like protein dbp8 [Amniculicola lignicola CBS 123094]|uniref:ATP-dependent RNA helicase-like protein dbp8 n=1 Tax=Amniculicola lignicola CBS 123094 TaxID=1392246 RepID=A0A6A5WBI8_9PLEO|nr:ATP-dependent RNA helicase-like protein dbp8 [Amniculicola lignicola CBS 123094]
MRDVSLRSPLYSDTSDSASDEELSEHQAGSRKRRKLSSSPTEELGLDDEQESEEELESIAPSSLPALTISRVQAKKPESVPKPKEVPESVAAVLSGDEKTTFASIEVAPWLIASLASMEIKRPTGIQKSCIPEILKGRDCIGGSRTGTGKTVAFAVPILQKWAEDPMGIFAVVITPTRELAIQIFEQFKAISAPQSLKPVLITGGADQRDQALQLASRPHVVITTPGRLAEHIKSSGEDTICGLRRVRFVVFDEADRLLAPGKGSMLPDIETCLSVLPPSTQRQTLLFTATVTPEVLALKDQPRPGRPPIFICEVDTETLAIPPKLQQRYIQAPVTHKECYLHVLLETPVNIKKSVIIFCNRTNTSTLLEYMLRLLGHRVTALHSGLRQADRVANLARFRAGAARILVATDVAARGLDIPEVALVINYDIPRDPDDYIHRVGRTARAGRVGTSVTLMGQRDVDLILAIEERVGKPLEEYEEEGVSIEGRVVRDALKPVTEKKREAMLQIEEGRDVLGKRKVGMQKKTTRS